MQKGKMAREEKDKLHMITKADECGGSSSQLGWSKKKKKKQLHAEYEIP